MKHFLLAVSLLITSNVFAQSYSTFRKNRPAYYQFNSDAVFYQQAAIAIDSFKLNGSDTVFSHSTIIDYDNGNGCFIKAHDTSFAGIASLRKSTGDDFFFNRNNDSIYFNNSSSLNQSWTMYDYPNSDVIKATVQSVDAVSVLGANDSVKTITLQAQDSIGNNISNIFNGKIFKVGKATGFVSGYSLFHFPVDTIRFSIVGIENPPLGLNTSELSPEKIFDFDVGDRFDYDGGWNTEPTDHYHYCLTKVIEAKQVSADGDSLTYTVDVKTHWSGNNWNDYYEGSSSFLSTETYDLLAFSFMPSKPFQWSPFINEYDGGTSWLIPSIYSPDRTVSNFYNNYFNFDDTCLSEIVWGTGPGNIQYAEDLGQVYSYYGWSSQNIYESLVYFNKGGVEWGDSITCIPLGIEETDIEILQIFPNPARDQLFLSGNFSPSQTHFTLLNSIGEEMKLNQLSNHFGSVSFDVHSLPGGFYALQVKNKEQMVSLKFVKQ